MNIDSSTNSVLKTRLAMSRMKTEAAESEPSSPTLTTMDRVTIGGAAVLGGALGAVPFFGAASNSLATLAGIERLDDRGRAMGAFGVAANFGAFLFSEMQDRSTAKLLMMACFAASGVAGGISVGSAAHGMILERKQR